METCEIPVPSGIDESDFSVLLERLNCVVALPEVKPYGSLDDLSFLQKDTDFLTRTLAMKKCFLGIICAVNRTKIKILYLHSIKDSVKIKNPGPFDWQNGDLLCVCPPIINDTRSHTVSLKSLDKEFILPTVMPFSVYKQLLVKVMVKVLLSLAQQRGIRIDDVPEHYHYITHGGNKYPLSEDTFPVTSSAYTLKSLLASFMYLQLRSYDVLSELFPAVLEDNSDNQVLTTLVSLSADWMDPPQINTQSLEQRPLYEHFASSLDTMLTLNYVINLNICAQVCVRNGRKKSVDPKESCTCIIKY